LIKTAKLGSPTPSVNTLSLSTPIFKSIMPIPPPIGSHPMPPISPFPKKSVSLKKVPAPSKLSPLAPPIVGVLEAVATPVVPMPATVLVLLTLVVVVPIFVLGLIAMLLAVPAVALFIPATVLVVLIPLVVEVLPVAARVGESAAVATVVALILTTHPVTGIKPVMAPTLVLAPTAMLMVVPAVVLFMLMSISILTSTFHAASVTKEVATGLMVLVVVVVLPLVITMTQLIRFMAPPPVPLFLPVVPQEPSLQAT